MGTEPLAILNDNEEKLLESLRRQERRWPRWRWVSLAIGIGFASSAGLGCYAVWSNFSGLGDEQQKTAVVMLLWGFFWVTQAWLALFCIASVFRRHPLHSRRKLLLKLADGLLQRPESNETTP